MARSRGREFDKRVRELTLQNMDAAMLMFTKTNKEQFQKDALALGREAARLEERMKTYDYSVIDKAFAEADVSSKKWAALYTPSAKAAKKAGLY